MILSLLPPELVAIIISFTDIPTTSSFSKTSSTNNTIKSLFSSLIYSRLAYQHCYLEELDASSASPVDRKKGIKLSEDYNEAELSRAIVAQNSLSNTFKHVNSWKEFVRRRWTIDRNWSEKKFKTSHILLSSTTEDIWRFKLDSKTSRIVFSTFEGSYGTSDILGVTDTLVRTARHFPHIELSESYFMIANNREYDVYKLSKVPELDGNYYSKFSTITGLPECQATKARYPYFVAVSHETQTIYLYNFIENKLVKTFNYRNETQLTGSMVLYIDFDIKFIYVALSSKIFSFNIESGDRKDEIEKGWPIKDEVNRRFSVMAMHYDSKGNYVIAYIGLNEVSILRWSTRDATGEVYERLYQFPYRIEQLVVENGRACLITSMDRVISLWVLDLKNHQDVISLTSLPTILLSPIPVDSVPGRIEITNDQIFIPCSGALTNGNLLQFVTVCTLTEEERAFTWIPKKDTQLNSIISFGSPTTTNARIASTKIETWNSFLEDFDQLHMNSFLVLNFGI